MEQYDLTGYLYQPPNDTLIQAPTHSIEQVIDHVGTGDTYVDGILHGIHQEWSDKETVEFASTLAALSRTVHGDVSLIEAADVRQAMGGKVNIRR